MQNIVPEIIISSTFHQMQKYSYIFFYRTGIIACSISRLTGPINKLKIENLDPCATEKGQMYEVTHWSHENSVSLN